MRHVPGLRRLAAALEALADAATPVACFLRDDDAGWHDGALLDLLDRAARAAVPIDLAVIPSAVSPALARALLERHDAAPACLGLHQHGWAHIDHEAGAGRKCEFGPARSAAQQGADIAAGRARLQALFGARLDGHFTPPWNRCSPATPGLLAEAGITALSRSRGAPAQQALPELPITLDWCRLHREGGLAAVAGALADALPRHAASGEPLGLMLHHAAMGADERAALGTWLAALATHPRWHWQPMRALARPRPAALAAEA